MTTAELAFQQFLVNLINPVLWIGGLLSGALLRNPWLFVAGLVLTILIRAGMTMSEPTPLPAMTAVPAAIAIAFCMRQAFA